MRIIQYKTQKKDTDLTVLVKERDLFIMEIRMV